MRHDRRLLRSTQLVIFYGLTNATFLNGQVVYIKSVTPTTFTAIFAAPLAWNSVTEDVPGNAVNYLGVTYYCILTNTNEVPPNATYWSLNYGPAAEPFGAQLIDTTNRTAYLTYAESAVSPSQSPTKLEGAIAARFLYDMEALFVLMSTENPILDALEVSILVHRRDKPGQVAWTEWRANVASGSLRPPAPS